MKIVTNTLKNIIALTRKKINNCSLEIYVTQNVRNGNMSIINEYYMYYLEQWGRITLRIKLEKYNKKWVGKGIAAKNFGRISWNECTDVGKYFKILSYSVCKKLFRFMLYFKLRKEIKSLGAKSGLYEGWCST